MSTLTQPRRRLDVEKIMRYAAEMDDVPDLTADQFLAVTAVFAAPDPEPKARSIEVTFQSTQPPTPTQMYEVIKFAEGENGAAFGLHGGDDHEIRMLIDVDVCDGRSDAETLAKTLEAGWSGIDYVKALLGSSWSLQSAAARMRSARMNARGETVSD